MVSILYVDYKSLVENPAEQLSGICRFIGISEEKIPEMQKVIDGKLYRNRL
jgi:hypothetical protein